MIKIKFCGLKKVEDFQKAIELKATYAGFIFYKKSPRYISPKKVKKMIKTNKNKLIKTVGVFVDENIEKVKSIFHGCKLDVIQFHGEETQDYLQKINFPYWKVLKIKKTTNLKIAKNYQTPFILLDTYDSKKKGGTGKMIDLEILHKTSLIKKKWIFAGGINQENITNFFSYNPYCLDINSGVEKAAGEKDHFKMTKLVKIIESFNQKKK